MMRTVTEMLPTISTRQFLLTGLKPDTPADQALRTEGIPGRWTKHPSVAGLRVRGYHVERSIDGMAALVLVGYGDDPAGTLYIATREFFPHGPHDRHDGAILEGLAGRRNSEPFFGDPPNRWTLQSAKVDQLEGGCMSSMFFVYHHHD